jgi:methylated-DNA-protein-cysteine methyltransferase-like protein
MAPEPSDAERVMQVHPMSNATAIFAVLRAIPEGCVATYGQVAQLAGLPRAARLVGMTLSALPEGTHLPWHRVINAQGRISLPADSPGFREQVARLTAENVTVCDGRISLRQFQWRPEERRPSRVHS